MPKRPLRVKGRTGFTLIELVLVMGIAAVIVAGALYGLGGASGAEKTQEAVTEFGDIRDAVHNLYAGASSYSGLTTAYISGSNAISHKWAANNTLTDPWYGSVTVVAPTANTGVGATATNNYFDLTFTHIPKDACEKLAAMDFGNAVYAISVNAGTPTTQTIAATSLSTVCNSVSSNSITWTMP